MNKQKIEKLRDLSQSKEKVIRNVLQTIQEKRVKKVRWQFPILALILTASVALFIINQTDFRSYNFLDTGIEASSKVIVEPQIAPLTDEEFSYVGTHEVPDATKDDFRKFTFTFKVEHGQDVISREVEMFQGWKDLMKSIDGFDRYWFGSGWELDNDSEDYAEYYMEFVLYTKGISEEQIQQTFEAAIVQVTLTGEEEKVLKKYRVSDYLEIVE
ncbi:hypothetical protein [Ureibacillus manganicus]|uniref:hypothetical protein n=1 Tax=Ureibacillus manganicus TaxID=1266064 RepID=UPI00068CC3C2|nr:hypothetical protein [Ureibacillus manganicus]